MSANISRNVLKHSGECCQTFREMSSNILGNASKNSWECPQIFRGILLNISGNVVKHSGECPPIYRVMFPNIPGNAGECSQTFQGKIAKVFEQEQDVLKLEKYWNKEFSFMVTKVTQNTWNVYISIQFCLDIHILYFFFGIGCLFIVLFTKQVFIFPKIYIVFFTKHQRRRSSNRLILVRVTYLKFT